MKCVMKNLSFSLVAGGAVLLALTGAASAQPHGGGQPRDDRGRDGMWRNGPPRDGERRDGMRRGPRAKGELMRLWRGIDELEKNNAALSKAQAAKVVALVLPVSKRQNLSDAQAQTLSAQLKAILTPDQLAKLEGGRERGPRGRGMRGGENRPGPRGGRGPGQNERGPRDGRAPEQNGRGPRGEGFRGDGPPPRPNAAEFEKTRAFMDALNPFYPPTGYANWKSLPSPLQQGVANRWREGRALLEALSRKSKS